MKKIIIIIVVAALGIGAGGYLLVSKRKVASPVTPAPVPTVTAQPIPTKTKEIEPTPKAETPRPVTQTAPVAPPFIGLWKTEKLFKPDPSAPGQWKEYPVERNAGYYNEIKTDGTLCGRATAESQCLSTNTLTYKNEGNIMTATAKQEDTTLNFRYKWRMIGEKLEMIGESDFQKPGTMVLIGKSILVRVR